MGLIDSVKDLYYQAEEKYYGVLDRVDQTIPVYKVVDFVDQYVPSFALLLVAVFLIIVLGLLFAFSNFFVGPNTTLTLIVKDADGVVVEGASVKVVFNGEEKTFPTDATGEVIVSNLPRQTQLIAEITHADFEPKTETITITDFPTQVTEITLTRLGAAFITKVITVVDESGANVNVPLTLNFRCTSPYAQAPPSVSLLPSDNGVARVEVPTNCERLIVSVSDSARFEDVQSQEILLDDPNPKIVLPESVLENGSISVSIVDSDFLPVTDPIRVLLFRYEDSLQNPFVGPIDQATSSNGSASFVVSAAKYVVKTTATGLYAAGESGVITITTGEDESVQVVLEENTVKGKLRFKIIDSVSDAGLENATVTLKEQSSQVTVEIKQTGVDSDGYVEFDVSKDILYSVTAEAPGYELGKRQDLSISDAIVEVELDPCTPNTCGTLRVKVVDQDQKPIENATVALFDADNGFLAGFENKISDVNGMAVFNSVSSGSYYAFSFKESAQGRSDTKFFSAQSDDNGTDPDYVVTINIPDGVVRAVVKDREGDPVQFALVSVFDARNDELLGQSFTGPDGVFELSTRSDKRVFLKVSQKTTTPRFADYFTVEKPVIPESVQEFPVKLEEEIIDKPIEVEFLGLFLDDSQATVLSAGEEYVAKFKVRVPENKGYKQTGMHIRTGTDKLMEKDPLFIKKVNSPLASMIRATRYDESSNLTEQQYQLTNSDAKWVNLAWNNPAPGIYEVEAEAQVKQTASIKQELTLFWRAFGQNGVRDRTPIDDTVTIELYAEAFKRIYEVGITTLCDQDFCFSARIRDKNAAITESVTESYAAKNLEEYELRFSILNNSETRIHNNANLRVDNPEENLLFYDYSVLDAQTQETTGVLNGSEFPRFDVGTLNPKNKIDFTTSFVTKLFGNGTVHIQLVSDERIVFEKNISIAIAAPKKMEATISPNFFPSGIEIDVNVFVVDAQTKLEIDGAVLRLKDRHDRVISTTTSGKDGFAYLTIPAQKPGEKLFIEIEKPGYENLVLEININGGVVEFNPDELGFSLNAKTKFDDEKNFAMTNLTFFPVKVKEMELRGDFRNLIDLTQTQDLLDFSYKDFIVEPNDTEDFKVRVFLSEEGKVISNRQDIEGELVLTLENFGKQWNFSLPVKIAIGIEGEVDDPTCLKISKSEWVTTTEGDAVRTEVIVENNCIINKQPVELKNFQGRVEWESNELGVFDVTIGENKTQLRSGYNKTILARLQKEQSTVLILTFTPYGGVNGVAKAKVIFNAFNPQQEEDQALENTVDSSITIVNLKDCISIEPSTINIEKTELQKGFTISVGTGSVTCGTPVDFEIESPLEVEPAKFTVQDGSTKEVMIFRGDPLTSDVLPGQYPVFIKGKFGTEQAKQFLQLVRVRVFQEGCIQLSRYEFDVYADANDTLSGFDTATLNNECFEKQVPVRVNMKDWINAMKTGTTFGLLAFGVSLVGDFLFGNGESGGNQKTPGPPKATPGFDPLKGGTRDDVIKYHGIDGPTFDQSKTYTVTEKKGLLGRGTDVTYRDIVDKKTGATYTYYQSGDTWTAVGTPTPTGKAVLPTGNVLLNTLGEATANVELPKSTVQKTFELGTSFSPALAKRMNFTGLQGLLGGGGAVGGIFGAVTNMMDGIFGTKNPLLQGLQAFMIATVVDYLSQEDEARFVTTQRDVELDVIAIQNPKEDILGLEQYVTRGVATHIIERKIINNIPDNFRFLAPLIITKNVNLIAPDFDKDIRVDQQVKPSYKALPEGGLDPLLSQALFGGRSDGSVPAVSLLLNPGGGTKRLERRGLVFFNKSSFTTKPEDPLYKVLRVMGLRHFYKDKKYSKDNFEIEDKKGWFSFSNNETIDPTTGDLEELPGELIDERFHLEFNAVPPEELTGQKIPPLLNCQDGIRVGDTGEQALPKVSLSWSWGDIEGDTCDTENPDGVFCDATQFSIALLKKINTLKEYVESNGSSFSCPSPLDFRSNTAEIPNLDVGISELALEKVQNDAKIIATIKNTNPQPVSGKLTVELFNAANGQKVGESCVNDNIQVLSQTKVECTFSGLNNGNYVTQAKLEPRIGCTACEDKTASNSLNINFTIGDTGLEECEPFSTARLADFLAASGITGDEAESVLKNVSFQANLIEDRYSRDFQNDFDSYAKSESFFEAPDYYTKEQGLGVYFRDPQLFNFKPSFGEAIPEGYLLPGPGKYNVTVDITFDDSGWKMFDGDGTNAKVNILFEKAGLPEEGSAFYVLPFDGTIGLDGRTNYGLNFRGTNVLVNEEQVAMQTLTLPNTTPVRELDVRTDESFKRLNTDERGIVLQVFAGETPRLVYSPSYATPVILKMSNDIGEAWAFYSVEVNNGAVDIGPQMSRWNGIGVNCKAFDDKPMVEYFFAPDTHGLNENRSCALIPGEVERTSYGFEFCDTKRFGDMFLKTVFFSPQDQQTVLKMNVVQKDAEFWTPGADGQIVTLDTKVLGGNINSMTDVFNLVKSEFMCVSNGEGKTEFWWNPKKVFGLIEDKENKALNECIITQ